MEEATDAPFPPPITPSTLRQRIESGMAMRGGTRGSLTRCAQKFGVLHAKARRKQPVAAAADDAVREIQIFQIDLAKLELLEKKLKDQIESNKGYEERAAAELKAETEDLAKVQKQAQEAHAKRRCLQRYEQLAAMTNRAFSQPRRKLNEQLREAHELAGRLQAQHAKVDKLTETRRSQFQLLMQCITDLKHTIKEDVNDEDGEHHTKSPVTLNTISAGKRQAPQEGQSAKKRKGVSGISAGRGQATTTDDDDDDEEEGAISEEGEDNAMQVESDPLYDDLA